MPISAFLRTAAAPAGAAKELAKKNLLQATDFPQANKSSTEGTPIVPATDELVFHPDAAQGIMLHREVARKSKDAPAEEKRTHTIKEVGLSSLNSRLVQIYQAVAAVRVGMLDTLRT